MKRVRLYSCFSVSFFTLLALAGFGFNEAGQVPAPAESSTAAMARKTPPPWREPVTIQRDTFGVPHVYGPTDASCVFRLHLFPGHEDYFWQIEDSYLRSLGRAAGVYGGESPCPTTC